MKTGQKFDQPTLVISIKRSPVRSPTMPELAGSSCSSGTDITEERVPVAAHGAHGRPLTESEIQVFARLSAQCRERLHGATLEGSNARASNADQQLDPLATDVGRMSPGGEQEGPLTDASAEEEENQAEVHGEAQKSEQHTARSSSDCADNGNEGREETISLNLHEYVLANAAEDHADEIAALKLEHKAAIDSVQKQLNASEGKMKYLQKRVKREALAAKETKQAIQCLQADLEKNKAELDDERLKVAAKDELILELRQRIDGAVTEVFEHGGSRPNGQGQEGARQSDGSADSHDQDIRRLQAELIDLNNNCQTFLMYYQYEHDQNQELSRQNDFKAAQLALAERIRSAVEGVAARRLCEIESLQGELRSCRAELTAMKNGYNDMLSMNQRLLRESAMTERMAAAARINILQQVVARKEEELENALRETHHYRVQNDELRNKIAEQQREVPQLKEERDCSLFAKDVITTRLMVQFEENQKIAKEKTVLEERYATLVKQTGDEAFGDEELWKTIAAHMDILTDNCTALMAKLEQSEEQVEQKEQERFAANRRCETLEEQLAAEEGERVKFMDKNVQMDCDNLAMDLELSAEQKKTGDLEATLQQAEEEIGRLKGQLSQKHKEMICLVMDRSGDPTRARSIYEQLQSRAQSLAEQLNTARNIAEEHARRADESEEAYSNISWCYDELETVIDALRERVGMAELGWTKYWELKERMENQAKEARIKKATTGRVDKPWKGNERNKKQMRNRYLEAVVTYLESESGNKGRRPTRIVPTSRRIEQGPSSSRGQDAPVADLGTNERGDGTSAVTIDSQGTAQDSSASTPAGALQSNRQESSAAASTVDAQVNGLKSNPTAPAVDPQVDGEDNSAEDLESHEVLRLRCAQLERENNKLAIETHNQTQHIIDLADQLRILKQPRSPGEPVELALVDFEREMAVITEKFEILANDERHLKRFVMEGIDEGIKAKIVQLEKENTALRQHQKDLEEEVREMRLARDIARNCERDAAKAFFEKDEEGNIVRVV